MNLSHQIQEDNYYPGLFEDGALCPDEVALSIKHYKSQIDAVVERLMDHHWTQQEIIDGWQITPAVVRQAFLFQLEATIEAMVCEWSADDLFFGQFGNELQHEIKDAADKLAN